MDLDDRPGRLMRIVIWTAAALGVACLRVWLVPPAQFVVGDDAATCAGVARLSERFDADRLFPYHPPKVPAERFAQALAEWKSAVRSRPGLAYYRFDTMPGIYLLGMMSRGLGPPAVRMGWICFAAGTVAPLLLVFFLVDLLGVRSLGTAVLAYLFVALSGEMWFAGSAYVNDKIVAVAFLFAALLVMRRSGSRPGLAGSLQVAGAALLFAFAVLARVDSVLFAPAVLLAGAVQNAMDLRRRLARAVLFAVTAVGATLAVMTVMDASALFAWGYANKYANKGVLFKLSWAKIWVAVSALGLPGCLAAAAAAAGLACWLLRRDHGPDEQLVPARRLTWSPAALQRAAVVGLLVLPESVYLVAFPFASQKYLLVMVSVACALPVFVAASLSASWQRSRPARPPVARVLPPALLGVMLLIGVVVPVWIVDDGPHGDRPLGGSAWFRMREGVESSRARAAVTAAATASGSGPRVFVVENPDWMMESALGYWAASSGWRWEALRTDIALDWRDACQEGTFADSVRFWESLGYGEGRVSVTLSRLVAPNGSSIVVPGDVDGRRGRPFLRPTDVQRAARTLGSGACVTVPDTP